MMKITFLNHASLLIEVGEIKLLSDPWYSGSAFDGGWSLLYDNPNALDIAATATHLWISHFHTDHFHLKTLKELVSRNSEMQVLANDSVNFQMPEVMKKLGFQKVFSFKEREKVTLAPNFQVTRFPATGIDNMLLIETKLGAILNYNDCNLPLSGLRQLLKKMPPIDIFMNNFNHARKLIELDHSSDNSEQRVLNEKIRQGLKERFKSVLELVAPRLTIPFASMHLYCCPEAIKQNESLLHQKDLRKLGTSVVPFEVGEVLSIESDFQYKINSLSEGVTKKTLVVYDYKEIVTDEQLIRAAEKFYTLMRRHYIFLPLFPSLKISLTDQPNQILSLSRGRCEIVAIKENRADISAHSESLLKWFEKPYGTDSFFVGARFDLLHDNKNPMHRWLLLCLLKENKLDLLAMLQVVIDPRKWSFYWNRREEIISILFQFRFHVGSRT